MKISKLARLALAVALIPCLASPASASDTTYITADDLKPLHLDTVLVDEGRPNAVIIVPPGRMYEDLAPKIQAAVERASGARLPIVKDYEVVTRYAKVYGGKLETNAVVLGNIETSGLVLHLYALRLCAVDSLYPGKGGSIVQTIHDPWGNGTNIILLGGSDIEGIAQAADLFGAEIKPGRTLTIPPMRQIECSAETLKAVPSLGKTVSNEEISDLIEAADKAFQTGAHGGVTPHIARAGQSYLVTGEDCYARLFREYVFLAEDLRRRDLGTYGGPWGMDADFKLADVMAYWNTVEESPALSAEDRHKITNILLDYVRYWGDYWSLNPLATRAIRNNHTGFTSLGYLFAGRYFSLYYNLPEAERWTQLADACFRAQRMSYKSQEDAAGYLWISVRHMLDYSLVRPDMYYVASGNARMIADHGIMTMDNLGHQASYGDHSSFSGGQGDLVCWRMLNSIERDGRYAWADKKGSAVRPYVQLSNHANNIEPVEPTDLLGIKWLPVDPEFYRYWIGRSTTPHKETFDKLTFRESFDPEKPYLLIDGINACYHGHYDANAILRFSDRGRIWLADGDYIKSQQKFHNTLQVFRDGTGSGLPTFAELKLAADLETVGFTKSRLSGMAGADWDRNIIWDKEIGFVFIDEVTATLDDEYSVRCYWHAIGDPSLDGEVFRVTQQGPSFSIHNLDGANLRAWDDHGLGKAWARYDFADPIVRTLQQIRTERLKAGERMRILNVLSTEPAGRSPVLALRVSDSAILVGEAPNQAVVGVSDGDLDIIPGLETDAEVYHIGRQRIAIGNAKRLTINGQKILEASGRVSAEYTPDGRLTLFSESPVSLSVPKTDLPAGRHQLASVKFVGGFDLDLPAGEPWATSPRGSEEEAPASLGVFSEHSSESGASYISMTADDTGIYAGTSDGKVHFISGGGLVWEYAAGSQVRAVWTGSLKKDALPVIAVGTAEGSIHLLDSDGKLIWKRELPLYKRTPSVVYFMSANLSGDGNKALVVGSENWHHYAFDAEGTQLWHFESVHASTTGAVFDLDGDGREEVLAGTEYYSWFGISPDGEQLWRYRAIAPRTNAVAAGNLAADGKPLVLFGGACGNVQALNAGGIRSWLYNTADEVTGLALMDLDGDGIEEILAASRSFNLHAIKADGSRLWRKDIGEPAVALALTDIDRNGTTDICVAGEDGRLMVLNSEADILAEWRSGRAVRNITPVSEGLAVLFEDGRIVVAGCTE